MKVVVVSGIWPPDVGGPASHAPALADVAARGAGTGRGRDDGRRRARRRGRTRVRWVSRSRPAPLRHLAVVREVRRAARGADRVYATTMVRRAALGAALARRPLVVKLVADEAFERERRVGPLRRHARGVPGASRRAPRPGAARDPDRRAPPRARASSCRAPTSARSRSAGASTPARVTVSRTPRPSCRRCRRERRRGRRSGSTDSRSARQGASRPRRRSATRSTRSRGSRASSCSSSATDPSGAALERHAAALGIADRVRFLGAGTRDDVLALFRAVDAGLLTSAWENLPHTLLEALAVGTPVIATAVGGIPEVVVDGENGAARARRRRRRDRGGHRAARTGRRSPRRARTRRRRASVEELSEPRILQRIVQAIVGDGRGDA